MENDKGQIVDLYVSPSTYLSRRPKESTFLLIKEWE